MTGSLASGLGGGGGGGGGQHKGGGGGGEGGQHKGGGGVTDGGEGEAVGEGGSRERREETRGGEPESQVSGNTPRGD